MESKSLTKEQYMSLFSKMSIHASDVEKIFASCKYPSEKLRTVRVCPLRIRDEYFTDFPNKDLESQIAFVATATLFVGEVRTRTFVWLPLAREVLIFEGEPFERRALPLMFPQKGAFMFYREEKRLYWRRYNMTRFGIKATEDFETIDGSFSIWNYYPLYFVRHRPFKL